MKMTDIALSCQHAGLCVLPARLKEKRPDLAKFKAYQHHLPSDKEIRRWFAHDRPLCVLTGTVSGNLELLDFDGERELFDRWRESVQNPDPDLLRRIVLERSQSGGMHVTYVGKARELRDEEAQLRLEMDCRSRGRNEIMDIAVKAFELSQSLRKKRLTADYDAKRRLLEIICLNWTLDVVSLVPTMRKPFDLLIKGLVSKDSRDDRI